jgi:hypothetical protein
MKIVKEAQQRAARQRTSETSPTGVIVENCESTLDEDEMQQNKKASETRHVASSRRRHRQGCHCCDSLSIKLVAPDTAAESKG